MHHSQKRLPSSVFSVAGLCSALLLSAPSCESAKTQNTQRAAPIRARFEPVLQGLSQPTDIQFIGTATEATMVVLQQGGEAIWFSLRDGKRGTFFSTEVVSGGELGLLGIAFHPKFQQNGLFYTNRTVKGGRAALSRIDEWRITGAAVANAPGTLTRNIMQLDQPFANHNAGQLQFGPDGFLYVGWGDGGSGGDPQGNAQNMSTWLGKMLRIDIDRQAGGKPYAVPNDNPFVGQGGMLPEIWALGLRNPWRYSFDTAGRLVVADVGQNRREEINIVEAGGNYGWNALEGTSCFKPPTGCNPENFKPPVFEYTHDEGDSIIGGYVHTGESFPALRGKYVFGDLNGKVWAIALPALPTESATAISVLGETSYMPTTFGRDPAGEIYMADYQGGAVYRLVPAK